MMMLRIALCLQQSAPGVSDSSWDSIARGKDNCRVAKKMRRLSSDVRMRLGIHFPDARAALLLLLPSRLPTRKHQEQSIQVEERETGRQ